MSSTARHVTLALPAVAASVGEARRQVDRVVDDADSTCREQIALAVSEASSNAVMHAYPDGTGEFSLFAVRAGGELIVSVGDTGRGVSGPTPSPGLGFGLSLIRSAATQIAMSEPPGGGTVVQMRFALGAGVASTAASAVS